MNRITAKQIPITMHNDQIAIVTPSFHRDYELCRTLNRSILAFLPGNVKHYVVVDRRDMTAFAPMRNNSTVVLTKEEILPRGFYHIPCSNRWWTTGIMIPVHGWLVQQIAKIAMAKVLREPSLLMVDSDAFFVRDVDPHVFAQNGRTRLYVKRGGIDPSMTAHITWHKNACMLLGITPDVGPPMDDYIGQIIGWKRDVVLQMCERIEQTSGRPWHNAISKSRQFSEYMTYGLFTERVADMAANAWIDENPRCNSYWDFSELKMSDIGSFAASLRHDDVAMMISTHSTTSSETRAAAITLATNGRL